MCLRPPYLKMLTYQHAHLALLSFNRAACVYDSQAKFLHHAIVFFQDFSLKDRETLFRIVRPTEIHARFIVLEMGTPGYDTIYGNGKWRTKEESDGWFDRERIDVTHPFALAPARNVASKGRVNITVS